MDKKRLYQYGVLGVAIVMIMASGLATIVLQEPVGTTMGYGDISKTFIVNSNDHTWVVTAGADNSGVIQSAIWDLNNQSGTVYLPSGNITYGGYVLLGNGTTLKGAGMYSTILIRTGNVADTTIFAMGKHDVEISDLTIHGNNSLSGGSAVADSLGIEFSGCTNVSVVNVRCIYGTASGLTFDNTDALDASGVDWGASSNFCIDNFECKFVEGAHHGIQFANDVHDGTVSNVRTEWTALGIDFGGGVDEVSNITVSNCDFINGSEAGMKMGGDVRDCVFSNINIEESENCGIKLQGPCTRIDFNNLRIKALGGNGIYLMGITTFIKFSNFQVIMNSVNANHEALEMESTVNNITFVNGLFDNNDVGTFCANLQNADYIKFSNVDFFRPETHCIYFSGGEHHVWVDTCRFEGGTDSAYGINAEGVTYLFVQNSVFHNFDDYGIYLLDGDSNNFTIIGNQFYDCLRAITVHADCDYFIIEYNICYPAASMKIDINKPTNATRICNSTTNICLYEDS